MIIPRRRGRILEVPNLLDETLLWERRYGVETDMDGVAKRATVQGIPAQHRECRLQQCERHKCVAQCRVAQRMVQWCEMHGDVAVAQMSEREHLSAVGRASTSEYVSSPAEWSVGSDFCSKSCWSKWTG